MHSTKAFRAPVLGLVLGSIALGATAVAAIASATPARSEALLLVDANSGKVLRADNATQPWYPASTSKLMTLYLTLSALRDQKITPDTLFTVSADAAEQSPTKMGFPAGTQVTVDNAIKMMMVKSANDMAVVLAEGVAGSIDAFAQQMTDTAHRLGMTELNFVNPNGLPDYGQVMSARDLAILARALIHEFPQYSDYWHITAIKYGRRIVRNYNPLIGRFPGADGMKTGFVCASGFNLVATATRGDRQLIAVVLGAPSSALRAVKAAEMLENGFNQNPLQWLVPSLGTLDTLTAMDAPPPDLSDDMCGRHRRRPATEEDDPDADIDSGGGFRQQRRCHAEILRDPVGLARAEPGQSIARPRADRAGRRLYRADAHAGRDRQARGRAGGRTRQTQSAAQAARRPSGRRQESAGKAERRQAGRGTDRRQGRGRQIRRCRPMDAAVGRGAGGNSAARPESRWGESAGQAESGRGAISAIAPDLRRAARHVSPM